MIFDITRAVGASRVSTWGSRASRGLKAARGDSLLAWGQHRGYSEKNFRNTRYYLFALFYLSSTSARFHRQPCASNEPEKIHRNNTWQSNRVTIAHNRHQPDWIKSPLAYSISRHRHPDEPPCATCMHIMRPIRQRLNFADIRQTKGRIGNGNRCNRNLVGGNESPRCIPCLHVYGFQTNGLKSEDENNGCDILGGNLLWNYLSCIYFITWFRAPA